MISMIMWYLSLAVICSAINAVLFTTIFRKLPYSWFRYLTYAAILPGVNVLLGFAYLALAVGAIVKFVAFHALNKK